MVGRLFVALGLSDDTRHALAAYLTDHLDPLPGSVVPPQNWHLTLRFLGDVAPDRYDRLLFELSEADLGEPFAMSYGGLGAFPKPGKATVLWLGVDRGEAAVTELAAAVERATVAAGFPPEDRPFRPHLTLARIRPPRDVWRWLEAEPVPPLGVAVGAVGVYQSHLGDGSARYELLDEIPLG